MRAIRGILWLLAWTAVLCGVPRQALAQQPVAALISEARRQLDELNPDSAGSILVRVLDPSAGASRGERVRALVLLGIAELMMSDPAAARLNFRQALALDPRLRVDSLADLQTFLLTTFDAARLSAARGAEPGPGILEILNAPASAEVIVDGARWEVRRDTVRPGLHRIQVLASGYAPFIDSVMVDSGATVLCQVALRLPVPAAAADAPSQVPAPPVEGALPGGVMEVNVPEDTTLLPTRRELFPIRVTTNRALEVRLVLRAAGRPERVWREEFLGLRAIESVWNLRGEDGLTVSAGCYELSVTARDSVGRSVPPVSITLLVERPVPETMPMPPPFDSSALLPTEMRVIDWASAKMFGGVGVLVGLMLSGEGKRIEALAVGAAVGGGVGLYLALLGPRATVVSPINVLRNQQLLEEDLRARETVSQANAAARDRAPMRVLPIPCSPTSDWR